jgi:hypothetical protein
VRGWTASAVEQAQDLYAESKAEVGVTSTNGASGRAASPARA